MNNAPLPFSFPVPHGQFFLFFYGQFCSFSVPVWLKKVLKFVWSHLFFLYRVPLYWLCMCFKVAWFVCVTKLFTQRFTVIYTSKLVWLSFLCGTQTMLETYSLSHHLLYCKMLWTWMGVLLSLARKMDRFETTWEFPLWGEQFLTYSLFTEFETYRWHFLITLSREHFGLGLIRGL